MTRMPTSAVNATSAATLSAVRPSADQSGVLRRRCAEERRQQDEREHREQVLDDEPADRDVAGLRVQVVVVGEHANQDDRAGDGQRHAEDRCRPTSPIRSARASTAPRTVATTLCAIAPGTATPRTASSSSRWNCRPTPNISRMTPISASCSASDASATKPGV